MEQQLRQRSEREDQLNHANAQIRACLDASHTGMMIADDQHIIRYANHAVIDMYAGSSRPCARPSPISMRTA